MEYLLFSVLTIVAVVFGEQLIFKDPNGQPIVCYKATKLSNLYWNGSDETVYVYMDEKNTEWTYLTTIKSATGPTDIYNNSKMWVANNDSPTNINVTVILDNTKGGVETDSSSRFWLLHSKTKILQTEEESIKSFLCMSTMDQELDKEDKTLQLEENNDIQQPENVHQNDVFCEPATVKLIKNANEEFTYNCKNSNTVNRSSVDYIYGNSDLGDKSILIKFNNAKEIKKYWLPRMPLKVIIHGWMGSYDNDDEIFSIRKAYVTVKGYNVIAVDWGRMAKNKLYPLPAYHTKNVGALVAEFLENLVNLTSINPSDIHVIGHSLGAHVAGGCGAAFSLGKIGRITGLDPAGPFFEFGPVHFKRLERTDAQFVDVIHTAGWGLGHYKSIGIADFYPNRGLIPQPGCAKIRVPWIKNMLSCSHARAYEFFSESVYYNNSFISVKCNSWKNYISGRCENNKRSPMGNDADFQSRGVFYLKTSSTRPYSISPIIKTARGNAPFGINGHKKEQTFVIIFCIILLSFSF